ncbi:MAG: hypothetical protein ACTSYM_12725 [Candidatus Baldrarchaeia archaeon]
MVPIIDRLKDRVLSLFVKHRSLTPLEVSNSLNISLEKAEEIMEDLAIRGYIRKRNDEYYLTEAGEKAVKKWGKGRWWIFAIILGESRKTRLKLKELGFLKLVDRVWFSTYSETLFEKVKSLNVEALVSKSKVACEIWDKHYIYEKIKRKIEIAEKGLREVEKLMIKRSYNGLTIDVLTKLRSIFLHQCEVLSMLKEVPKPKNIKHVVKNIVPKLDPKLRPIVSKLVNLFSLIDLNSKMSEAYNLYLELSSFQRFLQELLGEEFEKAA